MQENFEWELEHVFFVTRIEFFRIINQSGHGECQRQMDGSKA